MKKLLNNIRLSIAEVILYFGFAFLKDSEIISIAKGTKGNYNINATCSKCGFKGKIA